MILSPPATSWMARLPDPGASSTRAGGPQPMAPVPAAWTRNARAEEYRQMVLASLVGIAVAAAVHDFFTGRLEL